MCKKGRVLWVVAAVLLLPMQLTAQQTARWQPMLESAKRLASQSDRLVLVYFWADWCPACREMEQEVLDQPGFVSGLEAHYVLVKVNADHFPATARQYGVDRLPTTIVLNQQGQVVETLQGRQEASAYLARLNQVAATEKARSSPSTPYAQIRSGADSRLPSAGRWDHPQETPRYSTPPPYSTPGTSAPTDPRLADARAAIPSRYGNPPPRIQVPREPFQVPQGPLSPSGATGALTQNQPMGPSIEPATGPPFANPAVGAAPSGPRPNINGRAAIEIPPGNPPLGLDGYCPVSLADDSQKWTLGDRRWGAIHEGRTYLFAGSEQQRRFLSEPERFSPIFGGNDVVMAIDGGQTAPGRREHGAFFGSKVYLFASEETLAKFSANPNYYSNRFLRGGGTGGGTGMSERSPQPDPRLSIDPRSRYGGYQGPPASQPATRYR